MDEVEGVIDAASGSISRCCSCCRAAVAGTGGCRSVAQVEVVVEEKEQARG